VVTGKGGLAREISIPNHLVERLEALRLDEPRTIRDRGVLYQQRYAIGGGQALSQSFSSASKAALGYSTGLHGVRHSYAQQRNYESQLLLGDPERARQVVSQELGHFRPEITQTYLR
jgi:integrase